MPPHASPTAAAAPAFTSTSRRLPPLPVSLRLLVPRSPSPGPPLPSLRASGWIIFSASPHHPPYRPLSAVPGWQLLAVSGEATPPDWSHPGATLLTLADQARLGFRSIAFLPGSGHARKAAAYLFAVQRGARVIYYADARNAVMGGNLTRNFDVDLDRRRAIAVQPCGS